MRNDMPRLASVRSVHFEGHKRKLPTRGQMPRDEEALAPRQSPRSAVPHYGGPHVRRLGPVRQWLKQQAGRPWADVYSELRAVFDKRNTLQAQVLESALRQVEQHNVFFDEAGQARIPSSWSSDSYPVNGLYVHPHTGMLCYQQLEYLSAPRRRAAWAANKPLTQVRVTPTQHLRLLDGIWFWVELAPVTEPEYREFPAITRNHPVTGQLEVLVPARQVPVPSTVCRDVLTGQEFLKKQQPEWVRRDLLEAYGLPDHYARSKRQASHKDICRHVPGQQLAA